MSFFVWAKREAMKAWGVLYVYLFVSWRAEARQTGQSYDAIASQHSEQFAETAAETLLSFGPRVSIAIVYVALFGYLFWRLRFVWGVVEGAIYRYGILRVTVAGVLVAFGAMGYFEIAEQLPQWVQPEVLVGTREVEGL